MHQKHEMLYRLHDNRSLDRREEEALDLISGFLREHPRSYVAFSGGKDSSVMLHLISRVNKNVAVLTDFNDLMWSDAEEHCHKVVDHCGMTNYIPVRTPDSMQKELQKHLRGEEAIFNIFDGLIQWVADNKPQGLFMGIRAEENKKTRGSVIKHQGLVHQYAYNDYTATNHLAYKWVCRPMGYWQGPQVFAYIIKYGIPYHKVYSYNISKLPHEIRFNVAIDAKIAARSFCQDQWQTLRAVDPAFATRLLQSIPELRFLK